MVLVILAIVWIAVLLPPALRARAESRPADSITDFDRQLTTLRRTRPGQPRSSRLRSRAAGDAAGVGQPYRTARPVPASPARRPTRPPGTVRPIRATGPAAGPGRTRSAVPRPSSRSLKRRRDIFLALVTAATATLVLGLVIPSLRFMLLAHVVTDLLLAAYIALLIRQRNVMAEREMKVRFLPRPGPMEPVLLRRSVN